MGARVSTQSEAKARSDAIDRQIREESRNYRNVNMLLLGNDPEMSMIVKWMKVQHGLTNDDLLHYRLTIYKDSLNGAQALIRAIRRMGIDYADPTNHVEADHILSYHVQHNPSFVFSQDIAKAIHHLWQDPIMPKVMDRRNEFWLGKNAEYFFQEVLRVGSPDYIPTENDILRMQENRSLVTETRFALHAFQATIIDVGKRHLPKVWLQYHKDVACILFCVSLSDYDRVVQDDDRQNLLNDSFPLFESVVNSPWFTRSSVILFLTNTDVFMHKLPKVPFERYFPQYTGGADVNEVLVYIQLRFMQVNRARLPTYVVYHRTTDPTTPQQVFAALKEIILEDARKDFRKAPPCSSAVQLLRLRRTLLPAMSQKSRLWGIF